MLGYPPILVSLGPENTLAVCIYRKISTSGIKFLIRMRKLSDKCLLLNTSKPKKEFCNASVLPRLKKVNKDVLVILQILDLPTLSSEFFGESLRTQQHLQNICWQKLFLEDVWLLLLWSLLL